MRRTSHLRALGDLPVEARKSFLDVGLLLMAFLLTCVTTRTTESKLPLTAPRPDPFPVCKWFDKFHVTIGKQDGELHVRLGDDVPISFDEFRLRFQMIRERYPDYDEEVTIVISTVGPVTCAEAVRVLDVFLETGFGLFAAPTDLGDH